MQVDLREIEAERCAVAAGDGALVRGEEDARALIEEAFGEGARTVVLPVSRLDPAFFDLRTRLAGEFLQKLVNYRIRVAIVGDISSLVAASDALRDFVAESNRGRSVWFVPDMAALGDRLAALRAGQP